MPSTFDVARVRADTPATKTLTHLNNAGASLAATPVLTAQLDYLRREATDGGYETADAYADVLEASYEGIAALIGAQRAEIAVVESASRAWHIAFASLGLRAGDRVLADRAQYVSNALELLNAARRSGIEVELIPNDEHGQVSVDALRELVDERVRLVAVTHVPTSGGLINPVAEVGAVTRAAGVPFLLDACQSVGQLVVDVEAIGCDFLAATGRKYLRAPRGTGFLYVRSSMLASAEVDSLDSGAANWTTDLGFDLRPDARRFEGFERSYAAQVGLTAAVDYALALGMDAIEERVVALGAQLRAGLADIPGVEVHDLGLRRGGIVTFTVAGHDPGAISARLREQRINTSVASIDLARWDYGPRGLTTAVRASVHYYNDDADLDRLTTAISELNPAQ
ncbi:MAG: hypothetical protein QOC60_246 [Frankiaceae bacterium]|nr:hypothetical protein [Frankiaceae bacterium]